MLERTTSRALSATCTAILGLAFTSAAIANEGVHRRLTFDDLPAAKALVESGVQPVALLSPNESIIATVPENFSSFTVEGLSRVDEILPEDKIGESMRNTLGSQLGPMTLVVRGYSDIDMERFFLRIRSMADGTVRNHPNLPGNLLVVTASKEAFERMLELDTVAGFIEPTDAVVNGEFTYYCPGPPTPYGPSAFVTSTEGWDGPGRGCAELTYHFVNGTGDIGGNAEQAAVRAAMLEWTNHADLLFTETDTQDLDRSIDIEWGAGDHSDTFPFDGVGGVLAYAFNDPAIHPEPFSGDVHFDEAETWSLTGNTHLFTVALHELGHSLGLGHSNVPGAVMGAFYTGPVTGLAPDDIAGIQAIYSFGRHHWANDVLDWDVTQVTDEIALSRIGSNVYYNHGGRMFNFYWSNNSWQHACLDWGTTNVSGEIAAAFSGSNVYYRGTDGRLWNFYHNSSGWHSGPLSWSVTNVVGDITPSMTDSSVYYRGTDNSMYRFWYSGGWNHEKMIDTVSNVAGDIAVTNSGSNVYYKDFSGRMWNYYLSSATGNWAVGPLSWSVTNVAGDTTTSSIGSNVYYRGTDNRLWNFYWSSGWQNSPLSWSVTNVDANVTTAAKEDASNVFYSDPEGRMWNFYRSGGTWANDILRWDVNNVRGPAMAEEGHVYYRGKDNRMWNFYWAPCPRGVN